MAIAAFLMIGATRQLQQTQTTLHTEERAAETRFEMLARNAALYGLERGSQGVGASFANTTYTGTLDGASYTTTVTVSGKVATIRSRGYVADARGKLIRYMVVEQQEQRATMSSNPTLPPFMTKALFTRQNLEIGGNVDIDTFRVAGTQGRSPNANIHTNDDLTTKGNSATIRGFATYVSDFDGRTSLFRPYNPSNLPVVSKVASQPVPQDFSQRVTLLGATADRKSLGNVTLSGTHDFTALGATREDPYVWYIAGNLSASSTVTIKGYVIFAATGNIELGGGASAVFGDTRPESHAAWYTSGNVILKGNAATWGQFYAHGNLEMHGTTSLYGNAVANGNVVLQGTPNIYYIAASPYLTRLWQNSNTVAMHRISYSEGWA
jgi:hypothetical protein